MPKTYLVYSIWSERTAILEQGLVKIIFAPNRRFILRPLLQVQKSASQK